MNSFRTHVFCLFILLPILNVCHFQLNFIHGDGIHQWNLYFILRYLWFISRWIGVLLCFSCYSCFSMHLGRCLFAIFLSGSVSLASQIIKPLQTEKFAGLKVRMVCCESQKFIFFCHSCHHNPWRVFFNYQNRVKTTVVEFYY